MMKNPIRVTAWTGALAFALILAPMAAADYERAMSAYKSGKFAEAAAEFQALVDQSPNYDFGHYMLGLSFFRMGKHGEAVANIQQAIDIDGSKFDRFHALASVYRAKREQMKALRTLNEAEGLVTEKYAYHFYSLRGFVNADLDKWADAIEDLERARSIRPSPQISDYLGRAYFKLGYHDKAAPVLREVVRADSGNANAHLFLAESLLNLGREAKTEEKKKTLYAESLRVAKTYRAMRPNDYKSENLVGKAALGAQDYKAAEEAFRRVLELKPKYCYAMVNLGKSYIAESRWKAAENILREAAACAPRMFVVYDSLGFTLQRQQRLEEALEAYKQAYSIEPSASIKQRMEIVAQNIRIRDENIRMDQEEAEQQEAIDEAEREYQEALEKQKEWEKKRDD